MKRQPKPLDASRQAMAEESFRWACYLAWRAHRKFASRTPIDELISAAMAGLVRAAARYDEEHGVPFRAYMTIVIRREIVATNNRWRNIYTREQSAGASTSLDVISDDPQPGESIEQADDLQQVRKQVGKPAFDLLMEHHGRGVELCTIARREGVTGVRIGQRAARARQRASIALS